MRKTCDHAAVLRGVLGLAANTAWAGDWDDGPTRSG